MDNSKRKSSREAAAQAAGRALHQAFTAYLALLHSEWAIFSMIGNHRITRSCRSQMLDNPKKTEPLLVALRAAVPFEVELMPALIEHLRAKNIATLNEIRQTVSDVSYAGDEGGIVCHIVPSDRREALVVSLTHVRMSSTMPLASAVIDYQKHRVKKLKKQKYN